MEGFFANKTGEFLFLASAETKKQNSHSLLAPPNYPNYRRSPSLVMTWLVFQQ